MRTLSILALSFTGLFSCSDQSRGDVPYGIGYATLIGQTKGGIERPVDDGCEASACTAVHRRCGGEAYADVVTDAEGGVLDVLCYRGNVSVKEIGPEAVESASAGNNTVLVFDAEDDGVDVTGDVVLEGNNAIVYGKGPEVSVIGGDLSIDKNNAIVRGVTVAGDVTVSKNNAQLAFVVIHGDLTLLANNTTLAESRVFGEVRIAGNNSVLVQNELQTTLPLRGKNLTCNANLGFDDADGDLEVTDEEEVEPELACSSEGESAP